MSDIYKVITGKTDLSLKLNSLKAKIIYSSAEEKKTH